MPREYSYLNPKKIQYTNHSQVTVTDADWICSVTDTSNIRSVSLKDINDLLNDMEDYYGIEVREQEKEMYDGNV